METTKNKTDTLTKSAGAVPSGDLFIFWQYFLGIVWHEVVSSLKLIKLELKTWTDADNSLTLIPTSRLMAPPHPMLKPCAPKYHPDSK